MGLGLELTQAAAHGALRGGTKEPLEFVNPSPSGFAMGPLCTESAQGGAEGVKATEEMLSVGKDTDKSLPIGVPAVGDDDLGVIPQGLKL